MGDMGVPLSLIALLAAVVLASPAAAADLAPGSWRLALLDGAEFGETATLVIGLDGRIGGQAPCNAWFARGLAADGALFGPIGSTKMACDALGLENAFFDALSMMQTAETSPETSPGGLTLRGDGREMLFVAQED